MLGAQKYKRPRVATRSLLVKLHLANGRDAGRSYFCWYDRPKGYHKLVGQGLSIQNGGTSYGTTKATVGSSSWISIDIPAIYYSEEWN